MTFEARYLFPPRGRKENVNSSLVWVGLSAVSTCIRQLTH